MCLMLHTLMGDLHISSLHYHIIITCCLGGDISASDSTLSTKLAANCSNSDGVITGFLQVIKHNWTIGGGVVYLDADEVLALRASLIDAHIIPVYWQAIGVWGGLCPGQCNWSGCVAQQTYIFWCWNYIRRGKTGEIVWKQSAPYS